MNIMVSAARVADTILIAINARKEEQYRHVRVGGSWGVSGFWVGLKSRITPKMDRKRIGNGSETDRKRIGNGPETNGKWKWIN